MTRTLPLELPFRGDRKYLHGTDLHQAVCAALADEVRDGPVEVSFHSLLRRQPDLVFSKRPLDHLRTETGFRAEWRIGPANANLNAVLMESTRAVTMRKSCDELRIAATAVIDQTARTSTLCGPCPGSPIERIVFATKQLHVKVLPHITAKWVFARLQLRSPLPDMRCGTLTVVLRQVLAGRFTRSDVILDDEPFGSICFSTP